MAVPAAATTGIEIVFTGGALLATQTLTIGDVQFEAGNAATSFEQTNMIANLANCQRYHFRTLDAYTVQAYADSIGRQLVSTYNFPVTMRVVATPLTGGYSGGVNATQAAFTSNASSALAALSGSAVGGFSAFLTWGSFSAEL